MLLIDEVLKKQKKKSELSIQDIREVLGGK
jgi:hypothetical protein